MVDSIVVVDVQTYWALFQSECDLKATEMNMQHSLIQELILYKFKLGHYATKEPKVFVQKMHLIIEL